MTATASNKTLNPPLHNFRCNVKDEFKLMIVSFILHMFAAPAVILSAIICIYSELSVSLEVYVIIGTITTAIAGFLGIFPAINSFSCLHNKSLVDMKLSMPLTARQRFASNFLSGLFSYIVPFLAAQVFSVLLILYGVIFMDGRTFIQTVSRYSYDGYVHEKQPYVCEYFGNGAGILFRLILCGLLVMLMVYVIAVLVTVCCGSKFESIAYTIIINALIPLTEYCVTWEIYSDLYGLNAGETLVKLAMYTSPLGGILAAWNWAEEGMVLKAGTFNYPLWAAVYFLISLAMTALAYFLYMKRRAEQVSKPFVFKLLYYIIITCVIVCIAAVGLKAEGFIPTLMISFIAYMIFEVVTNRGFKRFWVSMIKYAVTIAAATGFIAVGVLTDGFGAVRRIPNVSAVASAEICYSGAYSLFDSLKFPAVTEYLPSGNADTPLVFKDKENIKIITEAHQAAIDDYMEHRYISNFRSIYDESVAQRRLYKEFTVKYNLAGGGSFTRTYYYQTNECTEALAKLDCTEEYKAQTAEAYRKAILAIPEAYEKEINDPLIREDHAERSYYAGVRHRLSLRDNTKVQRGDIGIGSLCARGFYEQLAEAYYTDIMNMTEENYYHSEYKNIWKIYLTCDMDYNKCVWIYVPESFANTVRVLKDYSFDMRGVDDFTDKDLYHILVHSAAYANVSLYGGSGMNLMDYTASGDTNGMRTGRDNSYVYDFDEDLLKLIRSAQPMNIGDENGYIISIYGFANAVPREMYPIAAQVKTGKYDDERVRAYRNEPYGFAE